MTRLEALHSYTAAPAWAAFQEEDRGRLIPGLAADFVVLSNNLVSCADGDILNTEILETWVEGRREYRAARR